jgi:hypothetical protein
MSGASGGTAASLEAPALFYARAAVRPYALASRELGPTPGAHVVKPIDGDRDPGEEEREDAPRGRVAASPTFGVSIDQKREDGVERHCGKERRRTRRGCDEHRTPG